MSAVDPGWLPHVSIVLCTYNRCDLLPTALASLIAQEACATPYEIIIVDNNSTDETAATLNTLVQRYPGKVRALFEGRQGLSYARNAGVAAARAPLVAFTDDDIVVSKRWIETIMHIFADDDVSCAGGKVLPIWPVSPPSWLTQLHWSPLALVDRGDAAIVAQVGMPLVFVGANLVVRRRVFEEVGGFAVDLQRVRDGIGSTEDHEFLLRVYAAGMRGLYIPELLVRAPVQVDRMTKRYHRRWHAGHGRFVARMALVESSTRSPKLFGVPSYYYGGMALEAIAWTRKMLRGDVDGAFHHELELRSGLGFIAESRLRRGAVGIGPVRETMRFAGQLVRKKLRA